MKPKLFSDKYSLYGFKTNHWVFVKKVKGGYEMLGQTSGCKDYLHDTICNRVHGRRVIAFTCYPTNSEISLNKLQLVMFFDKSKNKKKHVYSTKRMINSIERSCGIKTTKIVELNVPPPLKCDMHAFLITADKIYIQSPALMHGLVAFLRTMHNYDKVITRKNVLEILQSGYHEDCMVLIYVIQNKIMELLMLNHSKIFKGYKLKDIYPPGVTNFKENGEVVSNYHSGFGMAALRAGRLASKKYSDRVVKVLSKITY